MPWQPWRSIISSPGIRRMQRACSSKDWRLPGTPDAAAWTQRAITMGTWALLISSWAYTPRRAKPWRRGQLAMLMGAGVSQAYHRLNLGFVGLRRQGDLATATQMEKEALEGFAASGETLRAGGLLELPGLYPRSSGRLGAGCGIPGSGPRPVRRAWRGRGPLGGASNPDARGLGSRETRAGAQEWMKRRMAVSPYPWERRVGIALMDLPRRCRCR